MTFLNRNFFLIFEKKKEKWRLTAVLPLPISLIVENFSLFFFTLFISLAWN